MKYSFVIADTDAQLGTTFLEYEKEIAKGILHYIEQVYTEQGIIFPDNGEIYIIKSPSSINPRFCLGSKNNFANDFIIITAKKLLYWCQALFQISHEMTHAGIQYNSPSDSESISWIEETICEAMSLFFLKRAACTWEKIKPDWFDESYKDDIDSYLKDMLSETGTDELTKCTNLKMLKSIDRESQNNRNTRKNEMHKLFSYIDDTSIFGLISYRKYIMAGTILLDTKKYKRDFFDNEAVAYLCDLQDKIIAPWKAKMHFIKTALTNLFFCVNLI